MMIHPFRDFYIALAFFVMSLVAVIWGFPAFYGDSEPLRSATLGIGLFVLILAPFMVINFWTAIRLKWRLEKGEGIIASWSISPSLLSLYVEAESQRGGERPHWQPNLHDMNVGIDVAFGPESVLLGGRLCSIPRSGLQSISAVGVYWEQPPVIEFQTRVYVPVGATVQSLRVSKGLLRVPAPDNEKAELIRSHFQDLIDGKYVATKNWGARINACLIAATIGVILFIAGFVLLEPGEWSKPGNNLSMPMILQICGGMCMFVGLVVAFVAWRLQIKARSPRTAG